MSIHFVSGKPGGGKTLYALKLILEELLHGDRLVVTNVALKLPELNEFIQKRYPDALVNLFSRVRLLSESEASEFWKYRLSPHCEDRGAFIVLDELHLFFNARKWMETGEDCLHYLSQHRKLGDDMICVTQHIENVDKQFRSVAQDFTVVRNGYRQKIGWFRGLPCFTRRTYSSAPNGERQQPFETAHFRLDSKGLAACYDTAAGIGVHGRHADKQKAAKGLHPLWFGLAVAALALFCFFAIKAFGDAQARKIFQAGQSPAGGAATVAAPESGAKKATEPAKGSQVPGVPPPSQQTAPSPALEPVRARGYVIKGSRVSVLLSDGRVLTESEVDEISRGKVRSGDLTYSLVQAPESKPRPVAPQTSVAAASLGDMAPALPPPPPEAQSSWILHADGVYRLREQPRLTDGFSMSDPSSPVQSLSNRSSRAPLRMRD